jgi:D-glycero-D-manno-heptose 1,7-bisphosphate phosphatase
MRPEQAVILAGGRGRRMRPHTDFLPKPMLDVGGRPFLDHLVSLLREQGISRVLMLLGYRAEDIQRYFGDGERWGLHITYAVSDESNETGRRLALARDALDPMFLLLYGDNYWPLRLDMMCEQFGSSAASAMVTVYRNRDAITRNNVKVDEQGRVALYDSERSSERLNGVEIGYMLISAAALARLTDANLTLGRSLLAPLAAMGDLAAYVTDHRYYTIGSPERLRSANTFLQRKPAVLLDRDGVLNYRPARAEYVRSWAEFVWLPGAKEALRMFARAGYRVVVVTNQPGIARGSLSEGALAEIHQHMRADAEAAGGRIDRIYFCPHDWDEGCECSKPRPGMLFAAQHDFDLDLSRTTMIGDDERDAAAAHAAGCPSRLASSSMTLLDHARALLAAPLEAS